VYAICYRYFNNAADAEDAAQEAFVALYRRASTFAGTARFSTWMYRVTTNACNDLARKRARRPRIAAVEVADLADDVAAEDLLARRELSIELAEALRGLDPLYRRPVVLHDVVGLPYADIAAALDLPVGTVKSRIHRGHGQLAAALGHLRGGANGDANGGANVATREPSGPTDPPTPQP